MIDVRMIRRDLLLEPPDPMRAQMDEQAMEELVGSIRELGIMLPLLVKQTTYLRMSATSVATVNEVGGVGIGEPMFEIIDGHRRYVAAGLAHFTELPCRVLANADNSKLAMMVHANIMREDVSPAEEGLLFLQLADREHWGIEQLMSTFKCSENYINDRIALVTVDADVCDALVKRQVIWGVAKALLKCKDEPHRRYLLSLAITHGANVRTVETWIQQWRTQQAAMPPSSAAPTPIPAAEVYIPPAEVCLWCLKSTYPEQFMRPVVHRWCLDSMKELLLAAGVHVASPSSGEGSPDTAESASEQ